MLVVQGAALIRCARRVSGAVVDGKGLPARCLRASRPRNTRPKTPSLHFALRSLFYLFRLRRRGARAASTRAPGHGSYFFALGCFKLNRPSFVSRRALS